MNKQVTMKMWADTRTLLNSIKKETRESLVYIMHRLVADEAARLMEKRNRTISTWQPAPRPREAINARDNEDDYDADDTYVPWVDPRCTSLCSSHTPWSIQAVTSSKVLHSLGTRTRCVLPTGHEGVHMGPDDSMWEQEEEYDD